MKFEYHDGGRSKYFAKETVRDCVVRAIAIASGEDYKVVYDKAKKMLGYTPRNGVKRSDTKKLMKAFGGEWFPTMSIGSGCKVHLCEGEIPMRGHIICDVSKHVTAVINGVIHDTYDCSRDGYRCVYGYWRFKMHKPFKAYEKHEKEKKDDLTYLQHQVFGVYRRCIDYIYEIDWALPACDDEETKKDAEEMKERLCEVCAKCKISLEGKKQYTSKKTFKTQPDKNTLWHVLEEIGWYLFDTSRRLCRLTANHDEHKVKEVEWALY